MKDLYLFLCIVLVVLTSCGRKNDLMAVEDPIYIPYCRELVIDGDISDWKDVGMIVPLISNLYGELQPRDYKAKIKLAWNKEQLIIIAHIEDDILHEHSSPLRGDGLEIFFSQEKGSGEIIKYIISPGVTAKYTEPRVDKYSFVAKDTEKDVEDLSIVSSSDSSGYILEIGIPWSKVGIRPEPGSKWALNLYLSDVDPGRRKTRYALYFNQDNSTNYYALQEMELDPLSWEKTIPLLVKAFTEDRSTYKIRMFSDLDSEGMEVSIKDGKGYRRKLVMEVNEGVCMASIDIPRTEIDSSVKFLDVQTNNNYHTSLFFRDFSNRYVNTEKSHRFEDEILFFEELDRLNFPPAKSTLFIGSSSIRLWGSTIADDFEGINVLCRGFGGSTTEDALYYFDRIVLPYCPASIIMGEGSNDIARGVSPEEVVESTRTFIEKTASLLPDSRIFILSIKVSVARKKLVEKVLHTNKMLQEMIQEYDNAEYVDVVSEMMTKEGKVRGDIFSSDSLHMNNSGYEIWTRILTPVLRN